MIIPAWIWYSIQIIGSLKTSPIWQVPEFSKHTYLVKLSKEFVTSHQVWLIWCCQYSGQRWCSAQSSGGLHPVGRRWDRREENECGLQVKLWRCFVGHHIRMSTASGPPFWWVFKTTYLPGIVECHTHEDVFICSSKKQLKLGVSSVFSSTQLDPMIQFFRGQTGKFNDDRMGTTTPTSFMSSRVAAICHSPYEQSVRIY